MSEERANCTVREKNKIDKNKFNDRGKLSVVFDRAMSNVYENTIFPTLLCDMVEIHNITAKKLFLCSMNDSFLTIHLQYAS